MTSRWRRLALGLFAAGAVSLPVLNGAVAAPKKPVKKPAAAKPDLAKGKLSFIERGCKSCHKTKEHADGSTVAPDLSKVGSEHTAVEIGKKITNPGKDSTMPAFIPKTAAEKTEFNNLVAYLAGQK